MKRQFDYVNNYYGLNLRRGTPVTYTDMEGVKQSGRVTSSSGAHIYIRFDGSDKVEGPFHPTWNLKYGEAKEKARA